MLALLLLLLLLCHLFSLDFFKYGVDFVLALDERK